MSAVAFSEELDETFAKLSWDAVERYDDCRRASEKPGSDVKLIEGDDRQEQLYEHLTSLLERHRQALYADGYDEFWLPRLNQIRVHAYSFAADMCAPALDFETTEKVTMD